MRLSQEAIEGYRFSEAGRRLIEALFPLQRVHVGPDTQVGQEMLARHYSAELFAIPSGTYYNDWVTPPGWRCKSGRLTGPDGTVVADFRQQPLSVFAYSPSFRGKVSLGNLQNHLLSAPEYPDLTMFHFRNQYSHESPLWGFSLPHSVRMNLPEGQYDVDIQVEWYPNATMYQCDLLVSGQSKDELLLLGHFDHPAQLNDGLIGVIAAFEAVNFLRDFQMRRSYRALSLIEIVGSALALAAFPERFAQAKAALFLTLACAKGPLTMQGSFFGVAEVDSALEHVLRHHENSDPLPREHRSLIGNDENVFDSAGVGIPTATLLRWPFPSYHSEADNLTTFDQQRFEEFVRATLSTILILDCNYQLAVRRPGLPRLRSPRRDLYISPTQVSQVQVSRFPGSDASTDDHWRRTQKYEELGNLLMRNLLRMATGEFSVLDVANRTGVPFSMVSDYVCLLDDHEIIDCT